MANETPRFTSRLPYVVGCLFGLTLFFLDITYQTFDPLNRIKISSKNFLQVGLNNLKNSFESVQINFSEKKLKCLSDILNEFDYKQYHFMTVDKTFHRSDLFLENHHYTVYDNQKIRTKLDYEFYTLDEAIENTSKFILKTYC